MGCCASASTVRPSSGRTQEETDTTVTLLEDTLAETVTTTKVTAGDRAVTQLKLVFDSIDADADGTVSKEELAAAIEKDGSLGAFIEEAGLSLNTDLSSKDGRVSWEEFQKDLKEKAVEEVRLTGGLAAAEGPAHKKVMTQLKGIFDSIDANQDGSVSKDELAVKLKADCDEHGLIKDGTFGQLVEEAGFNPSFRTFESLNTNSDDRITWEEFEKNLRGTATLEVKEFGEVAGAVEVEERASVACWGCC